MSRWKWALLIFELVLFAVILILPQVELPQCAFHGGSAPVTAKARTLQVPQPPVLNTVVAYRAPKSFPNHPVDTLAAAVPSHAEAHLALMCTFLI
jgi:hypothetical protein